MELISTVTVGAGGATTLDFTSIPGTFTDLLVVFSGRSARINDVDALRFRINGDTNTNYSYRDLIGIGTTVYSFNGSSQTSFTPIAIPADSAPANTFGNIAILLPNYTSSAAKTGSAEWVSPHTTTGQMYGSIEAFLWNNTAAITSLSFYTGSTSNLVQNTTASLYGILKGSGGATVS